MFHFPARSDYPYTAIYRRMVTGSVSGNCKIMKRGEKSSGGTGLDIEFSQKNFRWDVTCSNQDYPFCQAQINIGRSK